MFKNVPDVSPNIKNVCAGFVTRIEPERKFYFYLYMYGCFVYMSVYVLHVWLVPREARKGFLVPSHYSYRWL